MLHIVGPAADICNPVRRGIEYSWTMSSDLLLALVAFAFAASITPGPNNLMVMASGANFGLRRTVPHLAGILVGFVVMVALVGLGLSRVFEAWPAVRQALVAASALYLACWRGRSLPPRRRRKGSRRGSRSPSSRRRCSSGSIPRRG